MATRRLHSLFGRIAKDGRSFQNIKFWPFSIITWIPAVIFFNGYVGDFVWINGPSMYPFLNTSFNENMQKDICWNYKRNATKDLKRGMVISFRSPNNPETVVVKRVIALEGDTVYTRAPCPVPVVQIPRNHIWVEGDNRNTNKSLDSNTYGPISMSLIEGRITHILFPLKSFGAVRWWEFRGHTKVLKGRMEDAHGWD